MKMLHFPSSFYFILIITETVLQAVLRYSRGVADGVVKITALGKLDLGSVLEGLGNLQEALGNMIGVAGTVCEG